MKPLAQFTTAQPLARHDDRPPGLPRTYPRTDHHFQASTPNAGTLRKQAGAAELRAFREMSRDYLGEKTPRVYLVETIAFALVAGLAAWPLVSLLILMSQTANG